MGTFLFYLYKLKLITIQKLKDYEKAKRQYI